MNNEVGNLKGRIEAILFVAGEAVPVKELARALQTGEKEVREAIDSLKDEYDYEQRGFLLKRFGDHVQLATRPLYSGDVVRLLQPVQQQSLSQAAMETLHGENRVLVKNGLRHINNGDRLGVAALVEEAGLSGKTLSAGNLFGTPFSRKSNAACAVRHRPRT